MASDYENLKKLCANKDDRLKRQELLLEILKLGHKEPKKFQKDHIIIWKNKVDELNAAKEEQEKLNAKMASDYQNLLKECAKKDLEMKKRDRLLENLIAENKATQEQKEQLRNEINKLKAEKQAKESTKTEKNSDQEKEQESVKRDSKVNEHPKNEELKKEGKKDQEKEKESVKRDSKVNEHPKNEELKKGGKKDQEKEKESVKRDSRVNEDPKNEELKKECKKGQEKEKESVNRDSKVNEPPKNELKKECKKETENKAEDKRGKLLKEGLSAHKNKRFDEAITIFTDALGIDSDNKEQTALLHILRAEANASSGNPQDMDIVLDCCQAVDKGLQGCRAYMLRGKHLLKLGLFDAALKDFEASRKVEGSRECLKFIEDTKALKQKWESQSHYEVLGVGQTATRADVLKAFKGLSMKLHPDRHRDKPEFIQRAFEEKFKKVVNAKMVLTDDQSRRTYDAELLRQRPRQQPGQWDQRQQNFHFEPRGDRRQQNFHFEPRGDRRQQNFHFEPRGDRRQQNFHFEPRGDQGQYFYYYAPTGGQSHQWNHGKSFGNLFDMFEEMFKKM
ncbi:dnaJ homolog subfamily C member 3-like [Palaemon carinicauda]|uniref:dnaJ homolog subfamily C member 3-like n=1 Tax=Palaemon carinicauda TaxID=392227 RepID=UPI0035B5D0F8